VRTPSAVALRALALFLWPLATAASASEGAGGEAAREAAVARQQRLHEAKVLAERGRSLAGKGQHAEAREALREALRLNPDDAASRKLLAQAEAALGIASGEGILAHTRERHAFTAQVIRQQIQLDLFEAAKAMGEKDYGKAVQQAERALDAAGRVDDARSAEDLRERAKELLAKARAASAAAADSRRQADLDRARTRAAADRAQTARDAADGLRALSAQGNKFLDTKDYDKALEIARDMLRTDPENPDALALRDRAREASLASLGTRGKSRARREAESGLLAATEREMQPPKPNTVIEIDPKRAKARPYVEPLQRWELEYRSKLAAPVTMEFKDTPVAEAIEQLASVGGVNIILDRDAPVADARVTIRHAQKMPLEAMLRWVARFGNLHYCLRDGAIFLTGRSGSLDAPVTKMYDVATLLSVPTTAEPMRMPGPVEPGPKPWQVVEAANPDPEPIGRGWVDFIKTTIAPDTWERGDTLQQRTPYTVQYRNGRIVVVHVPEVQRQIETLLNDFRKARTLQVHMRGRFISIEKRFLDSINFSFSYGSGTRFLNDTVTSNMSPVTEVPSLAEFDNYAIAGGLAIRYSILDDDSLVLLLKAVIHEGKGTVLESPCLTCYNTQRANIQVLRNRNYVRRVGSDFVPEIGNIPEGTIFDIQPFVSADRRYITLVCQPQMRTFVSFTTFTYGTQVVNLGTTTGGVTTLATVDMTVQLPTTVLRSVGTTVTVPNGGTILMGGFTNVQEYSGIATAPFIEGIPLLRYIFRARDHIEGRRSLIMLITAETVPDIFEEEQG